MVDDQPKQTKSCSFDRFKMAMLLLEALEDEAFVELDPVPSAASRCTLQTTDVAASGELSQTVAKPQAVSNPALLPMGNAMPPGSAEKQAAEQSNLSYAVRYPFIGPLLENPINENNQNEYKATRAATRVQAIWRGLLQRQALKYVIMPGVKTFVADPEPKIIGAVVHFNTPADWSTTMDGHVTDAAHIASDRLPTGGVDAPKGGANDGSWFIIGMRGFDDCAIVKIIGCAELKYDDGGFCACCNVGV